MKRFKPPTSASGSHLRAGAEEPGHHEREEQGEAVARVEEAHQRQPHAGGGQHRAPGVEAKREHQQQHRDDRAAHVAGREDDHPREEPVGDAREAGPRLVEAQGDPVDRAAHHQRGERVAGLVAHHRQQLERQQHRRVPEDGAGHHDGHQQGGTARVELGARHRGLERPPAGVCFRARARPCCRRRCRGRAGGRTGAGGRAASAARCSRAAAR